MKKIRNILTLALSGLFLAGFLLAAILTPDRTDSLSERRKLAQRPALRASAVADGTYMTAFEKYSLDQFPLRDSFRRLKAVTLLDVLREKDNNGIYVADGYAAKLDPSIDEASVQHAADRFQLVYDRYLAGTDAKVFAAVIPDKNAFLARQNGYPAYDPADLSALLAQSMPYASMIDLTPALTLDSYYHTDLHWRQEELLPVARTLAEALGVTLTEDYETITADQPFYGVYCGQSALPLEPEPLRYLTNDTLRGCTVYDYETGSELPVYDLQQLAGEDAYAVFLSGSKALLTITNPAAKTDRELVVFRDSFASSLTPLLAGAYAKITLVDIRYLQPERLGTWLTFDTQDVLFLYSAPVLNSSETIR